MHATGAERGSRRHAGSLAVLLELGEQIDHTTNDDAFMRSLQGHSYNYVLTPLSAYTARGMSGAASTIRDWMLQVMGDLGWTPARWAREAGVAPSTMLHSVEVVGLVIGAYLPRRR